VIGRAGSETPSDNLSVPALPLNRHSIPVDQPNMDGWLSRLRYALNGPSGRAVTRARDALSHAQRGRIKIQLHSTVETGLPQEVLSAFVEQVLDHSFVISQPAVGGSLRQLLRFEHVRLTWTSVNGQVRATTQNLGRIKIPSGSDGRTLHGYELSIPSDFEIIDRRKEARLLGNEGDEATLYVLSRQMPLRGVVEDISPNGLRIACRNDVPKIQPGQRATVHFELPAPVGEVHETVTILGSEPSDHGTRVRVKFDRPLKSVDDVLKGFVRIGASRLRRGA
jgi:hypothetical protein